MSRLENVHVPEVGLRSHLFLAWSIVFVR